MPRSLHKPNRMAMACLYGTFAFYALILANNGFGLVDGLALIGFGSLAGFNLGLLGSRSRR